jgi:hypothetical protein
MRHSNFVTHQTPIRNSTPGFSLLKLTEVTLTYIPNNVRFAAIRKLNRDISCLESKNKWDASNLSTTYVPLFKNVA